MNANAKLFESLKYGGECIVCGDEVPSAYPGWVIDRFVSCAIHTRHDTEQAYDEQNAKPDEPKQVELAKEAPKAPVDAGKTANAILELVHAVNANTMTLSGLLAMMRNVVDGGVRVRTKENEPLIILADVR